MAAPVTVRAECVRVTLARGDADVVDEVSFEIPAGSLLGMVGESGSGKTTVALALMAHARRGLRIAGGRVMLGGDDVLAMSERELRRVRGARVAYVAQDPSSALNPALTVGRQLRETLVAHGVHDRAMVERRIGELLAEVRLDGVARALSSYPHQLSGGQQQRVMIAMAFASLPELVILDEPTTGLDVSTQRHILDTITRMCSEHGTAALYVSHDLAVVAGIVQSVAVMYAGRLIELGPTEEVFTAPAHPYTRGLLRAIPRADRASRLLGIAGRPPRPGMRPAGCSYAPRCPIAIARCSTESPPPIDVSGAGGHMVRCLRANESAAGIADAPTAALEERARGGATAPLLRLERVSAAYHETAVLHEVSLDVRDGECLAIVGESGSGKTTLARCIVGLHRSWSGTIELGGRELPRGIRQRAVTQAQAVQYVFQNPYTSLNPRKTIGRLVEQPLLGFTDLAPRERSARVIAALGDAALSDEYLDRYPDELSGGERQRVAIARSLVSRPQLLICDEITSSLDVSVQATVIELLRTLQETLGLTMLFITHNLAVVRSIAQRTAVMREGRIVEVGATTQIMGAPVTPYTRALLADAPRLGRVSGG